MGAPSFDLVSQITELHAQFQRLAELHPWVCIAIPTDVRRPPHFGELVWPSPPPAPELSNILDQDGRRVVHPMPTLLERAAYLKDVGALRAFDEHGKERLLSLDQAVTMLRQIEAPPPEPPPWVMHPRNMQHRQIVHHVEALTWSARDLLFQVLDTDNQIRPETQEMIREWDKFCPGNGWICWLRHATTITGPAFRVENYPQLAATALWELRSRARAPAPPVQAIYDEKAHRQKGTTKKGGEDDDIIAALTAHHQYDNGHCRNMVPIGVRELEDTYQVKRDRATRFFKKHFGDKDSGSVWGHKNYKATCNRNREKIESWLKDLNRDYSPHPVIDPTKGER